MHRHVTLLERLSIAAQGERARTIQEDRGAVIRSILRNMQMVLNSRQGHAPAQMDLGIPPPHELMQGFPGTLDVAQKSIRQCIQRYEPRVTAVVVAYAPGEEPVQQVSFRISAQLAGEGRAEQLNVQTAITSEGRIRISSS
jgi:type VI secretion system protein